MITLRVIFTCALLALTAMPARAIDYRCRTSPVGTSEPYCASEAFVTNSTGRPKLFSFSTLPSCNGSNQGQIVFISDSNVSTFNATITAGGGGNLGLAVCNGANWTFH
jgi:hypothetical protein